jgi:hypothetical protein
MLTEADATFCLLGDIYIATITTQLFNISSESLVIRCTKCSVEFSDSSDTDTYFGLFTTSTLLIPDVVTIDRFKHVKDVWWLDTSDVV